MNIEPHRLPEGWVSTTFGEIFDFKGGSQPPKSDFANEPRQGFIRLLQIRDFGTDKFPVYIKDSPRWPKCEVDDVLIARYGASLGRVLTGMEGAYNVALVKMIFDRENIDSKWTRYLLNSRHFQEPIHLLSRSAQNGFNKNEVDPIDIALPPLNEQRRIVAKIEALQERSRKAREALAEVGPLLEQFRQSLLAAAFRGDLTADWRAANPNVEPASELLNRIRQERRQKWEQSELAKYVGTGKKPPKGWQNRYSEPAPIHADELNILNDQSLPDGWIWAPAELIVAPDSDIVYGIVQPGTPLEKGVPYVRGKDIVDGKILVDQLLKTSQSIAVKYERASLKGGDILLGIIRATKVAIVPDVLDGANITQGTARFRPSSIIRTKYLAGWLDSPFAQNWLHAHYRGIDMPGLNLRDVRRLPVPIAPLAEQEALEMKIESSIAMIANATKQVAESHSELTQLDQSILAKAFRGELVPQDPSDEPASELLARIRSARQATASTKSKRKDAANGRK